MAPGKTLQQDDDGVIMLKVKRKNKMTILYPTMSAFKCKSEVKIF